MKLVFLGTPQFAVPTLKRLLAQPGFEVVAVVTQPDKRRGRGNQLTPSPVKQAAIEAGVTVWQPRRIKKNAATLEQLRATAADAFVVVAYGQILSPEILQMPRLGCINGHGSILPEYRGAAPIQWCLYDGVATTGMTTMLMDAGMDTGAMLLKSQRSVSLLDNAWTLGAALAEDAAELMVETLLQLDRGTVTPEPQDNDRATYAKLLQKEDFVVDWQRSAIAIHNQIRGFYPNCTTSFRGQPLKVKATLPLDEPWRSQLFAELDQINQADSANTPPASLPHLPPSPLPINSLPISQLPTAATLATAKPGEVVAVLKNWGAVVATGAGLLLLQEVQQAGKKAASGWDFANGARITIGECLG